MPKSILCQPIHKETISLFDGLQGRRRGSVILSSFKNGEGTFHHFGVSVSGDYPGQSQLRNFNIVLKLCVCKEREGSNFICFVICLHLGHARGMALLYWFLGVAAVPLQM